MWLQGTLIGALVEPFIHSFIHSLALLLCSSHSSCVSHKALAWGDQNQRNGFTVPASRSFYSKRETDRQTISKVFNLL